MTEISERAWNELVAAEVAYLLRRAGVPVLHIKGPTVALWLYEDGERRWGDVDILVPPSGMERALAILQGAGYTERFPGVTRRTTTDHAITLVHQVPGNLDSSRAEVDVHDRFEGMDDDPDHAFEVLWSRRQPAQLGHTDVWFPDLATRALLVALNTARDATSKAREDLARVIRTSGRDEWADVLQLALEVGALSALRAGLEIDRLGTEVVTQVGLDTVPISPEWQLRTARAPRTAIRLAELRRVDLWRRPGTILRWLFPAPGIIRMRDPAARGGFSQLVAGYLRRLRDGLRAVPPSVRALRHLTRGTTAHDAAPSWAQQEGTGPALTQRTQPSVVADDPASRLVETEYAVPEHVAWTEQAEDIVLLADLRSGARHQLSATGSLVWEAVAGGASRSEVDAQVLEAFPDPPPDYDTEIDLLLATLEQHGLLAHRSA